MDSSFVLKNLSANQNRGEFLSSEQQWKMAVSSEGSLAYSSDSFSNTSLIKFRVTRSKGRIIPVEKSKYLQAKILWGGLPHLDLLLTFTLQIALSYISNLTMSLQMAIQTDSVVREGEISQRQKCLEMKKIKEGGDAGNLLDPSHPSSFSFSFFIP